MKEAQVAQDTTVTIKDVPMPTPGPDQVVIKVIVSGSNPKDWKMPAYNVEPNTNSGDDIAGLIHSVGANVYEFKPGDRVASFHKMLTPGGSFAEYAIGHAHTTFHIPHSVSFEAAATLPLASMTAAIGLHQRMSLPDPWSSKPATATSPTPLVVYGGASAVGALPLNSPATLESTPSSPSQAAALPTWNRSSTELPATQSSITAAAPMPSSPVSSLPLAAKNYTTHTTPLANTGLIRISCKCSNQMASLSWCCRGRSMRVFPRL
ncbi:hypothetical protein P3342_006342 [Pyrenophora teres f. teres]|nr:hypothetical protein P3342_006342 [Pyrenophora teres f. teres]